MSEQAKRYRVALSFAGEIRHFVEDVAQALAKHFTRKEILYDKFHEAEFARSDLGIYLPGLYLKQSDLIVVVISKDYEERRWTGLEWKAIHALLSERNEEEVMLCRFDLAMVEGLYATAGFMELDEKTPAETAALILERWALNAGRPQSPPPARPETRWKFLTRIPRPWQAVMGVVLLGIVIFTVVAALNSDPPPGPKEGTGTPAPVEAAGVQVVLAQDIKRLADWTEYGVEIKISGDPTMEAWLGGITVQRVQTVDGKEISEEPQRIKVNLKIPANTSVSRRITLPGLQAGVYQMSCDYKPDAGDDPHIIATFEVWPDLPVITSTPKDIKLLEQGQGGAECRQQWLEAGVKVRVWNPKGRKLKFQIPYQCVHADLDWQDNAITGRIEPVGDKPVGCNNPGFPTFWLDVEIPPDGADLELLLQIGVKAENGDVKWTEDDWKMILESIKPYWDK